MTRDTDWARLGALLDAAGPEMKERLAQARALAGWDELIGPDLAGVVRPVRLNDEVLTLAVPSPVWAQELNLRQVEILRRLRPHLHLRELRFVVEGPRKAQARSAASTGDKDSIRPTSGV